MTTPLSDTRLTEYRSRVAAELAGHWAVAAHDDRTVTCACGDRVKADPNRQALREHTADKVLALLAPDPAAGSCPDNCPCRQIPLTARWDGEVSYPNPNNTEDTETVVCCVAEGGQPVAIMLDDELREALGLALLLPDGDGEVDPQHLELARENERLRAEVEELRNIALIATVLDIPRDNDIPLQLRLSYGHTDRWAICDRTGSRWDRELGWAPEFGGIKDDELRDSARFTLAEALPLARQLAAAPTP